VGKVRVAAIGLSTDGFVAGPDQDLEHPLGAGGDALFEWFFTTRTWSAMHGGEGGETGIDDDFARRGFENVGAWLIGRNMFGPIRGPWLDDDWKGWWGDEPPYRTPVFVLTHHARAPLIMKGGTTFHFVTEGAETALALAREAAGERDVRIGGGAATIRTYLRSASIDEMHLVLVPALLGSGEPLLAGLDLPSLGYRVAEAVPSTRVTHMVIARGKVR
jgi:dihydrofolate reductase